MAYSPSTFLRVSCLANARKDALSHGAKKVISLLSKDLVTPDFNDRHEIEHLTYYFHDQETVLPTGMVEAVDGLIEIGRNLSLHPAPVLVHCHGGVSRSTAAAYILLCAAFPAIDAGTQFDTLLKITRKPWPNLRMIQLAEAKLDRAEPLLPPLVAYRDKYPRRLAIYERLNRRRGLLPKVPR